MTIGKKDLLLYAVTDQTWTGKLSLYEQVQQAIEGGITCLQLREKNMSEDKFLQEAKEIGALCKEKQIPFIVNDDVEVAVKTGADGVHIGQSDMDGAKARALLGPDKILGISARTVEQAQKAQADGADYLGVGAVFHTSTKKDAYAVDFQTLKQICQSVSIPVVAIGGISKENLLQLKGSGVCGVALVSAVFAAEDIRKECRELHRLSSEMVEG
ncbi:MAG: thiamine phosphate synthase [Blautia sp.]